MIAGSTKVTHILHEWPLTELGAVDATNKVAEGENAPTVDAPVVSSRRSNYTQISDKMVTVSDTSQRVDAAANIEDLAKQMSYKLKELKRDKETILLSKQVASAGASGTARTTAGFYSFLITNASRATAGTAGTAPTLSGGTSGYPNAAGTDGTDRALTEDMFNAVVQACWDSGAEPKYALVTSTHKKAISRTFTGYATKYKSADDKKLINAIDVYESDFGQLQIVPDRFMLANTIYLIDPSFVQIGNLQPTRQLELARTGHAQNRLIQSEYLLEVGNEKAHGVIADLT
jgi:hypothetical protein